jgi:hypothetical protein
MKFLNEFSKNKKNARFIFLIFALIIVNASCQSNKSIKEEEQVSLIDSNVNIETNELNNKIDSSIAESKNVSKYRFKAFETIEFGDHSNHKGEFFKLLYSNFRFGGIGEIDYYYGLYRFHLKGIDKLIDDKTAIISLKDISNVIDSKYKVSKLINKKIIQGPSALMKLEWQMISDEFDESSIPKDAGTKFIFKRWVNKEIQIEIGYNIQYEYQLDLTKSNKEYKFNRNFELFVEFESPYLIDLMNNRDKAEEKNYIKKESSKF